MSKQSDTQDNYKAGDRLKITRKSLSTHHNNLWKQGVAPYHLPLIGVILNRQGQPVVTKVTTEAVYQSLGISYSLSFTLVGISLEICWHKSNQKTERIAL